jgi:hypothetical protein
LFLVTGESGKYEINATDCRITSAHKEITCKTGPGAGVGHKMILTIGGQRSTIPTIDYGKPILRRNFICSSTASDHGKEIGGQIQISCTKTPYVATSKGLSSGIVSNVVPAIAIGTTPCWHTSDHSNCIVPVASENDVLEKTTLETKGNQLILLSGINLGSKYGPGGDLNISQGHYSELESVTYGPTTGNEISMPIYKGHRNTQGLSPSALIPLNEPGCTIYENSFSILCNTRPGIAGPNYWRVKVRGQQSSNNEVKIFTNYASPIILHRTPSQLLTSGSENVILTGINFGTNDPLVTFQIIFSKVSAQNDCSNTNVGDCKVIDAYRDTLASNGNERIKFLAPEGWGKGWNLRMIVTNSQTSQTSYTDLPTNLQFNYGEPYIEAVNVVGGSAGSLYTLTISGRNFCNQKNSNCGILKRCNTINGNSTSDVPNENYCLKNLEKSYSEFNIISWTHTQIRANVGASTGIVYIQIGSGLSANNSRTRSNMRLYSTELMSLQANVNSDFIVNNNDIVYKHFSTNPIPTSGSTTKLEIWVEKLGTDQNVQVEVGGNFYNCITTDITNIGSGVSKVQFIVPEGAGPKRAVYVSKSGLRTQNAAYLWYALPKISSITMQEMGINQGKSLSSNVLSTSGGSILIQGENFGTSSMSNDYSLSFIGLKKEIILTSKTNNVNDPMNSLCSVHSHLKFICALPEGEGIGYGILLIVGGQSPINGIWSNINYAKPIVKSVSPITVPTLNSGRITINGFNFGKSIPTVIISGSGRNCTVVSHTHNKIVCQVSNGQGWKHKVIVIAGGQQSSSGTGIPTLSYDKPKITNFSPNIGRTDGYIDNNKKARQKMIINGENFGEESNSDFAIIFTSNGEKRSSLTSSSSSFSSSSVKFVVPSQDIIQRSHSSVEFYQPSGYGKDVTITITVSGQTSDSSLSKFTYETPTVYTIQPRCEEKGTDDTNIFAQCYGYSVPGFLNLQDYPKIISIVSNSDGTSNINVQWVKSSKFLIELGDTIRISGMSKAIGIDNDQIFNFNGDWTVINNNPTSSTIQIQSNEKQNLVGIPTPDTYLGWKNPAGNLRALLSKSYQSSNSVSFNTLETDGCSTRDNNGVRESQWEPYSSFQTRRLLLDATDPTLAAQNVRKCEAKQKLVIRGTGFGALSLGTPIFISMRRKICDCQTDLNGLNTPCMHGGKKICSSYLSDSTTCPKDFSDCSLIDDNRDSSYALVVENPLKKCTKRLLEKYGEPLCRYYKELEVVQGSHDHDEIIVYSSPGYGRRNQISIQIGTRWSHVSPTNQKERYLRYLPPVVTGFEVHSTSGVQIYRPDGKTRIAIVGYNLGYGSAGNVSQLLEIRIGTDYDASGSYCGDEDRCMKICKDATWHPEKFDGGSDTKGFPYIDCIIPEDTAGFKNISLRLAGQVDDCRTNQLMCGLPIQFPTDRRTIPEEDQIKDINAIAGGGGMGLVFTCSKPGELSQSYAKPGERCEQDINSECADENCQSPKAKPGFWRLDLDLQFACSSSSGPANQIPNKECQVDITGQIKSTGLLSLDSFTGNSEQSADLSLNSLCTSSSIVKDDENNNQTTCTKKDTKLRQCNLKSINPPGSCLFRRPKEARRALGNNYWPWSCPGTDLSIDHSLYMLPGLSEKSNKDYENAKKQCRSINKEGFDYINSLKNATCPLRRVNHLVNFSVYQQYPSLVMSDVCYGIVACSPKESCLGNNECSEGYEYNKFNCLAFNKKNPDKMNCTSDEQCRTRSGVTSEGSAGLSSACDPRHPEDCSRCIIPTNSDVGTCECVGGGPRCGLCRQAINSENSHDGKNYKGYFRLNDECQECPENPGLLLALMAAAVIVFCVGGWYLQDKNINVAFLSIGVDYFQVLAVFARIKVRWPLWVKQILQVLSIFNFNIDLAAPECIIPEFDYKVKWIIMMLLPLIFAGMLLLIFLSVSCVKVIKQIFGLGGKAVKHFSHGSKLISMFTIVFYFIYLTVTRRALDIFNCKEPDPPDGYTYTEFTSIECAGGTCVCNDPSGLQRQLIPFAYLGFFTYSIGFPIFVWWVTWYYRVQIKLDQLLRAHDLGDDRETSVTGFRFTPRKCRSKVKNTYDIRKKYHKLYYHFKPGKVYWMLVILIRKLLICIFSLVFRANVAFLLSCVLMVLFFNYVLQIKNKPYMSTVERDEVKLIHRMKAQHAEELLNNINAMESIIPREARLHYELSRSIKYLKDKINSKQKIQSKRSSIKTFSDALEVTRLNAERNKKEERLKNYYFDYNTVEQVLIMCSIVLSLVASKFIFLYLKSVSFFFMICVPFL